MACGGCAQRRLKQQAVSLEIAAQQEAERQAQRRAEDLASRVAEELAARTPVAEAPVDVPPPVSSVARRKVARG